MDHPYFIIIATIIMLYCSSYWILKTLEWSCNYWAASSFFVASTFLLPLISFVITKIISGNIALSLGMVGALSIVRFRHPVKNQLELVTYFALIAMGITFCVNWKWGLMLALLFGLTLLAVYFFGNKNMPSLNPSVSQFLLSVTSKNPQPSLSCSQYLSYYEYDGVNQEHNYRLNYASRKGLDEVFDSLDSKEFSRIVRNI